ncbi:MAG: MgtC/SapB family protein [Fimbriimonadaceae bacterium]|nr:MgtC/SapB family protein [Fimbriimonadaceae bacterium]
MGGELTDQQILFRLAVATALGVLLGLQREYSREHENSLRPAGVRTHAMVGLLGAVAALLGILTHYAVTAALLGTTVALLVAGYVVRWERREGGSGGMTSEVALLLSLVIGALAMYGQTRAAVVAAGVTELILSAKTPVSRFVSALSPADWVASLKFAVVTLVVLPILPNASYGPLHAFNPFKIWLLVVLISGISFLGYILTQWIGAQRGVALTGLIGGLASSTAVTLANAKRAREAPELVGPLALGTVLACTVMLPRLLLIIAAICPPLVPQVAPPFCMMLLVSLLYCALLYRDEREATRSTDGQTAPHANPFELSAALKFAAIFAAVSLLLKWVKASGAGSQGLYVISFIGGLAETDAIVVSVAEQARDVALALREGAWAIVLAAAGNSLLKGLLAGSLGGWRHGRRVLLGLLLTATIGAITCWRVG